MKVGSALVSEESKKNHAGKCTTWRINPLQCAIFKRQFHVLDYSMIKRSTLITRGEKAFQTTQVKIVERKVSEVEKSLPLLSHISGLGVFFFFNSEKPTCVGVINNSRALSLPAFSLDFYSSCLDPEEK